MQQYIFQNGLLIVILVYGTVTLIVIDAVIGMGMVVVIMELILGQLVVFSVEVDELSWTSETVFFLKELFMLTWMVMR
jgi:hypothetical protein